MNLRLPIAVLVLPLVLGVAAAQENLLELAGPATNLGSTLPAEPTTAGDVAVNRSGDGIAAWRTRIATTPAPTYEIRVQGLRRGVPVGASSLLATTQDLITGSLELTRVRCAIDDEGSWVVVWDASDPAAALLQVFARRFHAPTGQLGPVLHVSGTPGITRNEILPDVAIGVQPGSTERAFHVVWQDDVQQGLSRILLRRYRMAVSGSSVTDIPDAPIVVNSEPTPSNGGQDRPAIAIDAAGTLTIVWEKFAIFGPGTPYWRIMMRRRSGVSWLPILDPTSPGAGAGGLDFTDYEASPPGDPAFPSDARFPPRVAVAPDGRLVVAWRRFGGAPYGLRAFTIGPAATAAPLPTAAFQPAFLSPGHGFFDVALSNEGSVLMAWENLLAATGLSGRVVLSRLRFGGASSIQEAVIDPPTNQEITSVAVAAADTGLSPVLWTRGIALGTQRLWLRLTDLNILSGQGSAGAFQLHASARGAAGLLYQLWPSATGGDPTSYALTPLGDGRRLDLSLADPLLQWFFTSGLATSIVPLASGALDAAGEVTIPIALPAGIGPIPVRWTFIAYDPALPFPAQVRLFTQPEPIPIP